MERRSSSMPEGGIARLKQGWLIKQGGRVKNWKRRFFVLDGSQTLSYYVSEADAQAGVNQLGIIDLQKALFVKPRSQGRGAGSTTITWPASVSSDYCFMIITHDRNYGMYSDISPEDCRGWVSALQAVRGNVDSNEILVEVGGSASASGDQADYASRARSNTMAVAAAYQSMPERYNLPPDLPLKVVSMYSRWHRVLERALKTLADHFGVKSYKFDCNMSDLYEGAPKVMRNRLGELVFADYVDEFRFNLIDMVGDEPIGKEAFVDATKKRTIKFRFGELKEDEVVRASPANGYIEIIVPRQQFGKGVHLTGRHFLDSLVVTSETQVCGGVLKGMPLVDALNISKARTACRAALDRIGRMFSEEPPFFKCNYAAVHEEAERYLPVPGRLGDVIVRNLLTELAASIHAQFPRSKLSSLASQIGSSRIVFEMAEDAEAKETATINHNGELVIAAGLNKLTELAVYRRRSHFNLSQLVKNCVEESSM